VALAAGLPAAARDRPFRPQDGAEHGERILIDYFLTQKTTVEPEWAKLIQSTLAVVASDSR
jgi:hypothetical protein